MGQVPTLPFPSPTLGLVNVKALVVCSSPFQYGEGMVHPTSVLSRGCTLLLSNFMLTTVRNIPMTSSHILQGRLRIKKKFEKDQEAAKRESLKNILVFAEPGKFVLERKLRKGKPKGKNDKSMRASLIDSNED